jgi:hypothetical protein
VVKQHGDLVGLKFLGKQPAKRSHKAEEFEVEQSARRYHRPEEFGVKQQGYSLGPKNLL